MQGIDGGGGAEGRGGKCNSSIYVLVVSVFFLLLNVFLFAGEAEGGW